MYMSRRKTTTPAPTSEQEIALLRAQLASLARDNESLAADNARLAAEAAESAAAASALSGRVVELESKIARLVELIKLANLRHFAPRSEAAPDDQMCLSLFNDAEAWADPAGPEPELDGAGDGSDRPRRRRGGRRRIDTSKLERVVVEHDLEDRACPRCGSEMSHMKVEVTEVIRLVPAHLVVEEHRRHVYRCDACCSANAAGEEVASQIVRAPLPALTPLPRSFATASMLSWVINAKYANSMPYYRLEQDFRSIGAEVSRQDMANWTIGAHERWLSLIHARMRERLLECRYLNADETEVQVLKEPGREPRQKSYMWLFRTGPHEVPICVFEYHPTRSGSVPRAFLEGWSGYLTTDGYDPYFNLGIEGVTNTACLVHVRRKFAEIVKSAGGDAVCEGADSIALEARRRIDRIFRVDARFDELDPEQRGKARERKLRPLMRSFREWAAVAVTKAVPGLALHRALCYALKYWPYVMNVLKDGRLALDNNVSERAVKSFVIGRKNFLFSDTARGAEASAAIYSIVVTAKLNGLNQRAYLEWVLTEMPNDARLSEPGRIDRYLPFSDEVPASCRLSTGRPDEADALPDEPIVDERDLEAALAGS